MTFKNQWYGKRKPKEQDPMVSITVFISKGTAEKIKEISMNKDIPVSRLIAYAVDNELDCVEPFSYDYSLPSIAYVENAYSDQAMKVYEYMKQFPKGIGLDTLLMGRRDAGLPDRLDFLMGYRELIMSKMIEEFYPLNSKFKHAKDYRYSRVRSVNIALTKNKRLKVIKPEKKGPLNDV